MSKKIKCAILTFVLAALVAVSAAMSACTIKTKHPRVKITLSFNSVTYEIQYTLYRNMYPQTVQHFIELADAGYYNNMIVHNYSSNDWITGAYSYNGGEGISYSDAYSAGSSTLKEYLENNSKEEEYYNLFKANTFTPTVFEKITYDAKGNEVVSNSDALPTLIGEFSVNDHKIEKNALTAGFGALKMFYYDKGSTNQKVAIKNSFDQLLEHDYQYNCATSLFTMQVNDSTSYSSTNYCVFARLRNDSAKNTLEDLIDAISDYVESLGSTGFTTSVTTTVDNLDEFAEEGGRSIEYSMSMPSVPLIVKSVKVTKY